MKVFQNKMFVTFGSSPLQKIRFSRNLTINVKDMIGKKKMILSSSWPNDSQKVTPTVSYEGSNLPLVIMFMCYGIYCDVLCKMMKKNIHKYYGT